MAKNDKQIKNAKAEENKVPAELIEFDTWYGMREDAIPAHHKKEIIKADFKGRKVPDLATVEEFDEALKKYGVELK